MAGGAQKRKGGTATVFRKSAKKARQDKTSASSKAGADDGEDSKGKSPKRSETSGAAKRAAAKAQAAEGAKQVKPVRVPNSYTDVRAKAKPPKKNQAAPTSGPSTNSATGAKRPKTKHEFIQRKQQEAAASAAAAAAAASKKTAKGKGKSVSKKPSQEDIPALIPIAPPPASAFRIVFGSYERLLYGLNATLTGSGSDLAIQLKPYFTFPAHISSIRTVCCAGHDSKWLATGSTDESIKVWDLRKRIEVGSLTGHEGTITSLHFPTRQYLLTTSEDGRINIYQTRDWALLKTLKGHVGSVNDVAAHPSGRVALSVGKDRTIRMWDLMRGVGAASTKIGQEGEKVAWDTKGERFAVLAGASLSIYNTEMSIEGLIKARVRWHDVQFYNVAEKELVFVAGEDKLVHIYDVGRPIETEDGIPSFVEVARLAGHDNRVKSVRLVSIKPEGVDAEAEQTQTAVTISSDGFVRVFNLSALPAHIEQSSSGKQAPVHEFTSIASYDSRGSRLTCLSVVAVVEPAGKRASAAATLARQGDGGLEAEDEDEDEDEDDEEDEEDGEEVEVEEGQDGKDVDTDAEEEELQKLEEQIEKAKAAGLLESEDDDEQEDNDEGDDSGDDDDPMEGGKEEEIDEDESEAESA